MLDCWSIAIVSGASLALFLFLPINDDGSVEGGGTVIAVLLMVAVVSGGTMFVRMLRLAVDVGITPVIGWIAIAVNAKKQRFDDMAANTIVVRVD